VPGGGGGTIQGGERHDAARKKLDLLKESVLLVGETQLKGETDNNSNWDGGEGCLTIVYRGVSSGLWGGGKQSGREIVNVFWGGGGGEQSQRI